MTAKEHTDFLDQEWLVQQQSSPCAFCSSHAFWLVALPNSTSTYLRTTAIRMSFNRIDIVELS